MLQIKHTDSKKRLFYPFQQQQPFQVQTQTNWTYVAFTIHISTLKCFVCSKMDNVFMFLTLKMINVNCRFCKHLLLNNVGYFLN